MRAALARLLQHGDSQRLAASTLLPRREPDCGGEPGRAAPDNQDIDIEGFPLQTSLLYDSVSRAAISAGTTSNRSPTMPKSATSKIGASASLLTATIVRAPFIPTRC